MPKKIGTKNRKIERNRPWCQAYRARGQREKNKARKLRKHLVIYPGDFCAKAALKKAILDATVREMAVAV